MARASQRAFIGITASFFAASIALTFTYRDSMPMVWMRMPGQTWIAAAAMFLGMWMLMMVAMMMPSLAPLLWRYREAVGASRENCWGLLTALAGLGYFTVWAALGVIVYPLGQAVAASAQWWLPADHSALPTVSGVTLLICGALQLTRWRARRLACCRIRQETLPSLPMDAASAWRYGTRLGLNCCQCCAGPMAVLAELGLMDLRAMVAVTAAITVERLAPAGERVARALGVFAISAGLVLIARV